VKEVTKIINQGDKIKVDFYDEKGSYKMTVETTGDNTPSPDLTNAIRKLTEILASRLDMEDRRTHLTVTGVDTGNDPKGDWYRVHGIYFAHMFEHAMVTGKLRHMDADFGDDMMQGELVDLDDVGEKEAALAENYPYLLTSDEENAILTVLVEARSFVEGKRSQQNLDFEGNDPEDPEEDEDDDDYNEDDFAIDESLFDDEGEPA
jgi:hypothetical protein